MLHRLLNEAFSKRKVLALCSHFLFVSVCLKHLMLGALVDGRGAPGVVMAELGCTWKWSGNLVWKWEEQSSPPFPTAVNLPLPLLSQYGLGCCSASGVRSLTVSMPFSYLGVLPERSPGADNGKITALFLKTVFISIKAAEESFLGHRRGTSVG